MTRVSKTVYDKKIWISQMIRSKKTKFYKVTVTSGLQGSVEA